MSDLDPAAAEAATRAYLGWASDTPVNHRDSVYVWMQKAIAAYLDRSGLAEARASLERAEQDTAILRMRIGDLEEQLDEAVARAEKAEAGPADAS